MNRPREWEDAAACVDAVIDAVGPRLVVGTPLGLGKPILTLNELYRRACADRSLELTLVTGLTLTRPRARTALGHRLVDPLVERVFGGCPEPAWEADRRADRLPPNVRVIEFYLQPGALLGSTCAQRDHIDSNYTHVVRDALDRGLNVYAQMVGVRSGDRGTAVSLSCNADLTLDALAGMRARGEPCAAVADVNRRLPYMTGGAEVGAGAFDHLVDAPGHDHRLFGPPNEPVGTVDWMIALHASALVADGGMLQLGIGSLSDGIAHLLGVRQQDNGAYRGLLDEAGVPERCGGIVERLGGTGPFREGLYAATEMLVDGYLHLYHTGVLRRRAWPWEGLQRLADDRGLSARPDRGVLEALHGSGAVATPLRGADVEGMVACGILRPEVHRDGAELVLPGGRRCPADLGSASALEALEECGLGEAYRGGCVAHAGFFLGPESFYQALADLDEDERALFDMTGVDRVNALYGGEELRRLQARRARFLNSAMMVTLAGAAVSDALEDGRVVSGVGGQHDLVTKAHALRDGRSVLLLRSTRQKAGEVRSNVVFRYGHTTLPAHLRDLVVTEYGIAELRGRTERECCEAMVAVSDSRFQPELVRRAQRAGLLPEGWRVPERFRHNRPERLERIAGRHRDGILPRFPFGSVLQESEVGIERCLKTVRERLAARRPRIPSLRQLVAILSPPPAARPFLERMGLDRPKGLRERLLRGALLYALATGGALEPGGPSW